MDECTVFCELNSIVKDWAHIPSPHTKIGNGPGFHIDFPCVPMSTTLPGSKCREKASSRRRVIITAVLFEFLEYRRERVYVSVCGKCRYLLTYFISLLSYLLFIFIFFCESENIDPLPIALTYVALLVRSVESFASTCICIFR